jgi:hypothetical protein
MVTDKRARDRGRNRYPRPDTAKDTSRIMRVADGGCIAGPLSTELRMDPFAGEHIVLVQALDRSLRA